MRTGRRMFGVRSTGLPALDGRYSAGEPRSQPDRLAGDELVVLGRRALPREQYYREVGARLRRVIDCDALCWHTLDPETLLITSDTPEELISVGS